jgi:hypothetical protein
MVTRRMFVQEARFEDANWCWDDYLIIETVLSILSGRHRRSSVLLVDAIGQVSARNVEGVMSHPSSPDGSEQELHLGVFRRNGSMAELDVERINPGLVVAQVRVSSWSEVETCGLLAAIHERLKHRLSSGAPFSRSRRTVLRRLGSRVVEVTKNPWFVATTAAFAAGLMLFAFHL